MMKLKKRQFNSKGFRYLPQKRLTLFWPCDMFCRYINHIPLRKMKQFERSFVTFIAVFAVASILTWYFHLFHATSISPRRYYDYDTWEIIQEPQQNQQNNVMQNNEIIYSTTLKIHEYESLQKVENNLIENKEIIPNKHLKQNSNVKGAKSKLINRLNEKNSQNFKNQKKETSAEHTRIANLLQILKTPNNVKADPFTPRDASYSIVDKNGIRKPLNPNEPVILVWWPPDYLHNKKENFLEREFQGACRSCRLTTDRNQLARSNVILFDNVPYKHNLVDMPPLNSRRPEQAYVLWHRETPAKTYHLKELMKGTFDTMFNYTLSYRRDADIIWYLGNSAFALRSTPLVNRKKPQQFINKILNSKRHLAVWVVSNCDKTKGAVARMEYAQSLINAGLNLHRYGKCFNNKTPRKDFYEFLLPFKFYLAFENSWHCKDYLTEKFWRNSLMASLVPVIWGPSREDVAAVAPKHSYIHSEDFDSPADLVKYLNYLDENATAYEEYFKWRLDPVSEDVPVQMLRPGYEPAVCKICRVLNENNGVLPYKVLPSSIDWVFIDGDDSKCLLYDLE